MNRFHVPTDEQLKRARSRVVTKNAQRQAMADMLANAVRMFGSLSALPFADGGAVPRCEFTPGGFVKVEPLLAQGDSAKAGKDAWAGYSPEWTEAEGVSGV